MTGAGSGIGAAMCAGLSSLGARVAAVDIDADSVRRTAEANATGSVVAVTADVSTAEGTEDFIAQSADALGEIHGVHLNAGVLGRPNPLAETTPEEYDWEMSVNARGVYLGLRGAISHLQAQGSGGSIVVTASTAGLVGSHTLGIYSASKHAAVGLVRSAALDYSADGIRVNAICPGEVNTPMLQHAIEGFSSSPGEVEATRAKVASKIPIERVAHPAELAEAAIWLLSPESSYVTGATLVVDGALTAGRFTPREPEVVAADADGPG